MINRREWLRLTAGAGTALALNSRILAALQDLGVGGGIDESDIDLDAAMRQTIGSNRLVFSVVPIFDAITGNVILEGGKSS